MTFNDRDEYVLSTGRKFYANCGIIGISPKNDDVSEGYDGDVYVDWFENPWTIAEKVELAEFMIDRWEKWATEACQAGGFAWQARVAGAPKD